jgi:NAD+-dependent farnesol dehydrogenase
MRVLVTGATGYLGGHVAARLRSAGHTVVALVRPGRAHDVPTGCLPAEGDILDRPSLDRALEGCDALVHMAALVKVWVKDRREFGRVNVEGVAAVLRAAEGRRVRRIVYTSTIGALGPTGSEPRDETFERVDFRFRTDYERTKWLADRLVRERTADGLPVVTVYPGVVYGAGAVTEGNLLDRTLRDYLAGRLKVRLGRVAARICYAYADDVAEGHRLALEKGAVGRGYILGGENASQDELFTLLHEWTGRPAPSVAIPFWVAETAARILQARARLTGRPPAITAGAIATFRNHWAYTSERAIRELGYRITPLREGLRRTLQALGPAAATGAGAP